MTDLALLQEIVDLVDPSGETDTEQLAASTGRATFGPPWFEMRDALSELERDGLLRIGGTSTDDDGTAHPSPPVDRLSLAVTDEGRAALEPRNPA